MGQEIFAVSTASCCVGYMKPQHEIAPVLSEAAEGFLLPNLKDWAMLRAGQASSVVYESISPWVGCWSSHPMCKGGPPATTDKFWLPCPVNDLLRGSSSC